MCKPVQSFSPAISLWSLAYNTDLQLSDLCQSITQQAKYPSSQGWLYHTKYNQRAASTAAVPSYLHSLERHIAIQDKRSVAAFYLSLTHIQLQLFHC